MRLAMEKEYTEFFTHHRQDFQEKLLNEAVNVREKIDQILLIGNIDLLDNAHKLIMYVLSGKEDQLRKFAKKEGISWASHNLTLSFKLEWVQAIRRTMWKFLQQFDEEKQGKLTYDNFFDLEEQVNDHIDQFLNGFFLSYSHYKDQLIESQRTLVENLSVPIIPITQKVCVLPLIGEIDIYRSNTIEEKTLKEIGRLQIQTLLLDFSGIAHMEAEVIDHMMKTIRGANIMGCKCVITGIRPEVVRKITSLELSFNTQVETKATLQQALEDYLIT